MRRTILASLLLAASPGLAQQGGRGSGTIRIKQFGSVPGTPYEPTPDQSGFQQSWGTRPSGAGNAPETVGRENDLPTAPEAVRPVPALGNGPREWIGPRRVEAVPQGPVPLSATPAPPAQGASPSQERPLWEGLGAPAALTPADLDGLSDDQASGLGQEDFSRRVLREDLIRPSAGEGPRTPRADDALGTAGKEYDEPEDIPAPPENGGLFVAVELDASRGEGDLRDAVADFSKASGFVPDARFAPQPAGGENALSAWGWIPAHRLGDAVASPLFTRLEIEPRPAAAPAGSARTRLLVALRLPVDQEVRRAAPALLARLAKDAGFAWRRVVGIQRVPGSGENALIVAGEVPSRGVGRLLADPAVIKVAPPSARGSRRQAPAVAPHARHGRPMLLALAALLLTALLLHRWRRRGWVRVRTW